MQMKKDVHLTGKDLTEMVQLRPQDVGKYAIVPGPRDRLDVLLKKFENPVKNFTFMETHLILAWTRSAETIMPYSIIYQELQVGKALPKRPALRPLHGTRKRRILK